MGIGIEETFNMELGIPQVSDMIKDIVKWIKKKLGLERKAVVVIQEEYSIKSVRRPAQKKVIKKRTIRRRPIARARKKES